jgi:hypothetical protein
MSRFANLASQAKKNETIKKKKGFDQTIKLTPVDLNREEKNEARRRKKRFPSNDKVNLPVDANRGEHR